MFNYKRVIVYHKARFILFKAGLKCWWFYSYISIGRKTIVLGCHRCLISSSVKKWTTFEYILEFRPPDVSKEKGNLAIPTTVYIFKSVLFHYLTCWWFNGSIYSCQLWNTYKSTREDSKVSFRLTKLLVDYITHWPTVLAPVLQWFW